MIWTWRPSSGAAMSDIFGHEDATAAARRAPAEAPPSSFSESLRSSWEVTSETGRSLSASGALYDAYGEYLEDVRQHTGKSFPNPWSHEVATRAKVEAMVSRKIKALLDDDPTVPYRSPEEIRATIGQDRAAVRARRAEVARREFGFGAGAGAFLGTAGAIMTDPPVLASMFFGAPWATGLLRAAVVEAGAAGAGELVAQAAIQGSRGQFGEEPDIGEAALAVAIAAGGAGVLAPVVRGGAAGVRALLKQAKRVPVRGSLAKAAERFLRRQVELEDANPLGDTPAGRAEHASRMTEAQVALREGRPVRMPEKIIGAAVRVEGKTFRGITHDVAADAAEQAGHEMKVGDFDVGFVTDHGRFLSEDEAKRLLRLQDRPTGAEVAKRPVPLPERPPLAKRTLAEEAPDLDSAAARAEDDALEARVRAFAEAEPDARVTIEDGDTVRSLTARELVDEIDRDRSFVEQVAACLRGAL